MDRWAAHAQRSSDERAARWLNRQHQRKRTGQLTFMERWAAHAQRKSDETAAHWREIEPLRELIESGPGSNVVIRVYPSAWPWQGTVVSGGGGGAILLALLLLTAAIKWSVFRGSRSWTVDARYDGYPRRTRVRLPSELAAYRAAAQLVSGFRAEGPSALERWRADITASARRNTGQSS